MSITVQTVILDVLALFCSGTVRMPNVVRYRKGYSALCGGYLNALVGPGGVTLGGTHTRSPA